VPLLPEVEEAKERLGLFALAQVGVGIEGARVLVMGEKDTPLATAALRGWPLPFSMAPSVSAIFPAAS